MLKIQSTVTLAKHFRLIERYRKKFDKGDEVTQAEINEFVEKWHIYKENLRPHEKEEKFTLVDRKGNFKNLTAPRWVCHLLSLRHKSVHVLLKWKNPSFGDIFILQVRSWNKSDSPGHLDISVGGHVVGSNLFSSQESAYREVEEELGITKFNLNRGELVYCVGYECNEQRKEKNFYNTEWRDVYSGEIDTCNLENIHFSDGEVVSLYLCPKAEAKNLLNQKIIPLASALKLSLPRLS